MTAVKGMTRNTVPVNREAWLSEVKRIASERGITIKELSKLVAPAKGDTYIVTLHTNNPRVDSNVAVALGSYGADLNAIINTAKPEEKEEKNSDKYSEQLETIISLLNTIVDIWGGEKNEQSV